MFRRLRKLVGLPTSQRTKHSNSTSAQKASIKPSRPLPSVRSRLPIPIKRSDVRTIQSTRRHQRVHKPASPTHQQTSSQLRRAVSPQVHNQDNSVELIGRLFSGDFAHQISFVVQAQNAVEQEKRTKEELNGKTQAEIPEISRMKKDVAELRTIGTPDAEHQADVLSQELDELKSKCKDLISNWKAAAKNEQRGAKVLKRAEKKIFNDMIDLVRPHATICHLMDPAVVQQRLFDDTDFDTDSEDGHDGITSADETNDQQHADEPQSPLGSDASAQAPIAQTEEDIIAQEREALYDQIYDLEDALATSKSRFREIRELHFGGQDPGLPHWSPSWTREDLDIATLKENMDISRQLREAEEALIPILERAQAAGLQPIEDQMTHFVDQLSDGGLSDGEGPRVTGPRADIENWQAQLPRSLAGFLPPDQGRARVCDGAELRGLDMFDRDVDIWESSSLRAYGQEKVMLDEWRECVERK